MITKRRIKLKLVGDAQPQPSIPSPFLRLAFQKALKKLNSDPKTKDQK